MQHSLCARAENVSNYIVKVYKLHPPIWPGLTLPFYRWGPCFSAFFTSQHKAEDETACSTQKQPKSVICTRFLILRILDNCILSIPIYHMVKLSQEPVSELHRVYTSCFHITWAA